MQSIADAVAGSYTIATDDLRATVVPERGAKIVSLQSIRSGREWLTSVGSAPDLITPAAAVFGANDATGADECIPTISPCSINGIELPDHGEVWTHPWTLKTNGRRDQIHTSVDLALSPFRFDRTLSANEDGLTFDYQLTNLSKAPQKFLWAFHPVFAITGDERLLLPESIGTVRVECQSGFPGEATRWNWPSPTSGVRLDHLEPGTYIPSYAKVFADYSGIEDSFVSVVSGSEVLTFRFESESIPAVGIWLTKGGWNGQFHFAIELTTCATDSLNSVPDGPQTILPADGIRKWRFRLTLEPVASLQSAWSTNLASGYSLKEKNE